MTRWWPNNSGAPPQPQSHLPLGLRPASIHPRVRGTAAPGGHDAQLLPRERRGLPGHGQHHRCGRALPALGRAASASASLCAGKVCVQVSWLAAAGSLLLLRVGPEGGPGRGLKGGGAWGGAGGWAPAQAGWPAHDLGPTRAELRACSGTFGRTSVGTPTDRRRPGASHRGLACAWPSATRSGAAPTTCGPRVRPELGLDARGRRAGARTG